MREIKFRGLAEDGKWYYGYYCVNQWEEHTIFDNNFAKKVRPETVGQFTGLLDKNGKEIYEGDIIVGSNYIGETGIPRVVEFGQNNIHADNLMLWAVNEREVIGNIHENPHILK